MTLYFMGDNSWTFGVIFVITYTNVINMFLCTFYGILFLLYLSYKPEGRGFDFLWCHLYFILTYYFRPHYEPGIEPASNRNEYQEYFLLYEGGQWVWSTILSPSKAYFLETWEPQPPANLRGCPGLCRGIAHFFLLLQLHAVSTLNFAARIDEFNDVLGTSSSKRWNNTAVLVLIKFRNSRILILCFRAS